MSAFAALRRAYRGLAVFWLNLCLAFAGANVLALAYLSVAGRRGAPRAAPTQDPGPLRKFFPQLGERELAEFLRESERTFEYEPFAQFREKAYAGRYVRIHPAGFRESQDQGPWPPEEANFTVFVFGGSTVFGYGVPDDQTIASHLQRRLVDLGLAKPPRVYNFGRGAYFSTQERVLFEKLIVAGAVPDLAIFIDGLNDFHFKDGVPALTPLLEQLVEHFGEESPAMPVLLAKLPLARAVARPSAFRILGGHPAPPPRAAKAPERYDDAVVLRNVIRRYLVNKRLAEAAAREFGARAAFVWQPVPTYRYHGPPPEHLGLHEYSRFGYPLMADLVRREPPGRDFLWCADIQEGLDEPLYVDQVHYSPALSDRIATCIVDLLLERDLLG